MQLSTKVLVLRGGGDFFSNGINLNTIQAADDPVRECWQNIEAINNLVHQLLTCVDKLTISVIDGNAGGGGVYLALGKYSGNRSHSQANLYTCRATV